MARRAHNHRRAFTLMEMVVAVAAVAIVAVGLAAIFDSVGKTVAGGKKLSLLNTYAGLIESRMRRDFDQMSREGFLAIRQQWIHDDSGARWLVPVSDTDATGGRERRADEIVFFTRGKFDTVRVPVGRVGGGQPAIVSADAARIYYGHGQMVNPVDANGQPNLAYEKPDPTDVNPPAVPNNPFVGLGIRGSAADPASNPNFYAGNWTLLRLQTLLVKPRSTSALGADYSALGAPPTDPRTADSDTQVLGQVAAASIFRSLNRWMPGPGAPTPRYLHPGVDANASAGLSPRFASGLVDIATCDLAEVRAWVTGAQMYPGAIITGSPASLLYPNRVMAYTPVPAAGTPRDYQRSGGVIDRAHAWMDDAFPTASVMLTVDPRYDPSPSRVSSADNAMDPVGARVHFEPQSPNLLEAFKNGQNPLDQAFERSDRLMLAAQNFLPRCSEFIVEWSFGDSEPLTGETIWFGLPKNPTSNQPGQTFPYPFRSPRATNDGNPTVHTRRVKHVDGSLHDLPVTERLIYGYTPADDVSTLTSFFGYTDPTVQPPADANGDGQLDGDKPATPQAWPWPRMIRVTVVLSDPQEPTIESTFQFIFSTPADPGTN